MVDARLADAEMLKNIIENLLLIVIVRYNVPVELGFQLEAHRFDVNDVVANLDGRRNRNFTIFFGPIFAWLCN